MRRPETRLWGALFGLAALPVAGLCALVAAWPGCVLGEVVGWVVGDASTRATIVRLGAELAMVPGAGVGLAALAHLVGGRRPIVRLLAVVGLAALTALGTLLSPVVPRSDAALHLLSGLAAYAGAAAVAGAALLAPPATPMEGEEEAACPPS